MKKYLIKSFASGILAVSMMACSSTELEPENPPEVGKFKFSKQAQPKAPLPEVIEAISPLKSLNANSKDIILPQRKKDKAVYTPALTYRLADVMKKLAPDPKKFDEKIDVTEMIYDVAMNRPFA